MPNDQPHTIYRDKDGVRLVSVTTYIHILGSGGIVHWAWQQGVAGLDYRKVRDMYGDIGTVSHYLAFCKLNKEKPDLSGYEESILLATERPMAKFDEWLSGKKLEPVLLEEPMVSEKYRFGGTPDYYGLVDGVKTLLDFKTSNAVHQDYLYQVAAYGKLLEEHGHQVDDYRIIRFGRDEGDELEDYPCGDLTKHWDVFLSCQRIYNLQKEIRQDGKKRLVE